MPNIAVIGAQWGDEGKGKVVDALPCRYVVRFNGGPNAGHTLYVAGEKIVTHNIPSGIVRGDTTNLVGPGVICGLEDVVKELAIARRFGSTVWIDGRCPVILPMHILIDRGREGQLGGGKIGTTGRGIAPCYEDHVARRGLTIGDLVSEDRIRAALTRGNYHDERAVLARHLGQDPPSLDDTIAWCLQFPEIREHIADTVPLIHAAMRTRNSVLFEGAQGMMLDVMHGGRPFTTSSSCGRGAISNTLGVFDFDRVIGIVKAYTTRVGSGSFPTELMDETGDRLREVGGEYGATTGRPRRTGWLDLPMLRYTSRMGGLTDIVLTKLDVLSGLPAIRLCIGYMRDGTRLADDATLTEDVLREATPIYEEFPGWSEDIRTCRRREDLPREAQHYLAYIERVLGMPITGIGVGPERDEIIWSATLPVG